MLEQLTDILENAWSRLASVAETRFWLERRVDSTQGSSNFEKSAREEVDDASLPFWLWYKVGDDDPLSVDVEETESVGLAGRSIGQGWVRRQKEVGVKSRGSGKSCVVMVEVMVI